MTALAERTVSRRQTVSNEYPKGRLILGLIGRAWLWFLAASVVISLIPAFFGWHSYVIVSGSMEPGISAGDVVVSSPGFERDDVVGRVITFVDPLVEDHILTHRVVSINEDGTLMTKGDANPTADTEPVDQESVTGLGRLLVQFVGLPVVWAMTGNWLLLLVFVAGLIGSIAAVARDHEPGDVLPQARRIPSLSGLLVLALAASLAMGTFTPKTAAAAFNASTAGTTNIWQLANLNYTDLVNADNPYLYWKLDETGGSTAADSSGNGRTGAYTPNGNNSQFRRLTSGALPNNDPNRAVTIRGANACIATTSASSISAPQVFTVVAWFRAPSNYDDGGKIIGFERPRTGVQAPSDGAYDRHLYMDGNGRIWFGVYNNAHVALSSSSGLNNGQWHMVVGTQSGAGMRLYIDGVQVASNGNTVAETQNGWWRAGCGNLAGWGDQWGGNNDPGTDSATTQNRTFRADLDEVTVFTKALSASEVAALYDAR